MQLCRAVSVDGAALAAAGLRNTAQQRAGEQLAVCLEGGPEAVTMSLVSSSEVHIHVQRRLHSAVTSRWPSVQFLNHSDTFLPDQDLTIVVQLPCAVQQHALHSNWVAESGPQSEAGQAVLGPGKPPAQGNSDTVTAWLESQERVGPSGAESEQNLDAGNEMCGGVRCVRTEYIEGFHIVRFWKTDTE